MKFCQCLICVDYRAQIVELKLQLAQEKLRNADLNLANVLRSATLEIQAATNARLIDQLRRLKE